MILLLLLLFGANGLESQGPPFRPGGGRPLRVDPRQPLSFGTLLGGVAQTVARTDPLNAAQIRIRGTGDSDLLVSFLLPPALIGPGGASVPLTFGAGSAGYSPTRDVDDQRPFDPSAPTVLGLPRNGQGMIYLGGTALPPAQATAGSYGATIVLTISHLGN